MIGTISQKTGFSNRAGISAMDGYVKTPAVGGTVHTGDTLTAGISASTLTVHAKALLGARSLPIAISSASIRRGVDATFVNVGAFSAGRSSGDQWRCGV